MLPLTVLRRFDAVLAPSKEAVLKRYAELSSKGIPNIDAILNNLAKDEDGTPLASTTTASSISEAQGRPRQHRPPPGRLHRRLLREHPQDLRALRVRQGDREARRVQPPVPGGAQFAEIDLHPRKVDNITMGWCSRT